MKLTGFGKKLIAFFAIVFLGLTFASCTNCGDAELTEAQNHVNAALDEILYVQEDAYKTTADFIVVNSNSNHPDVTFTWTSSETDVINVVVEGSIATAKVTRPVPTDPRAVDGVVPVTLTVVAKQTTASGKEATASKNFEYKVVCEEVVDTSTIAGVKTAVINALVDGGWGTGDNQGNAISIPSEIYGRVIYQYTQKETKVAIVADSTGAIVVRGVSEVYTINDLVHVEGTATAYYGAPQISSPTVTKLDESDSHSSIVACAYEETTISEYTEKLAAALDIKKLIVDKKAFLNYVGATYKVYGKLLNSSETSGDAYSLEDPLTGEKISIYGYTTSALTDVLDAKVGQYVKMECITLDKHSKSAQFRVMWNGVTPEDAEAPSLDAAQKVARAISEIKDTVKEGNYYNGDPITLPTSFTWASDVTVTWEVTPASAIVDGKVSITEDVMVSAKATVTCGDVTDSSTVLIFNFKKDLPVKTVAEVKKLAAGQAVIIEGVIDCIWSGSFRDFFIADETGSIVVYATLPQGFKLGDKVRIEGTTDNFYGMPQIKKDGLKVTLIESGTWTMRTPVQTTIAEICTWQPSTAKHSEYLQATGKLTNKDSYYYLEDTTDSSKKVCLFNSQNEFPEELKVYVNQVVTLNFYFYSNSNGGKDGSDWTGTYRVIFGAREGEYILPQLTDEAKAQLFLDNLDVPTTVTEDFTLPEAEGLVWSLAQTTSAELSQNVVSVTRPEIGEDDVTISLTATYTLNSAEKTKTFTVTIKAKEAEGDSITLDTEALLTVTNSASSGYAKYNGDHTVGDITFTTTAIMPQSTDAKGYLDCMQFKAKDALLVNKNGFAKEAKTIVMHVWSSYSTPTLLTVSAGATATNLTEVSGQADTGVLTGTQVTVTKDGTTTKYDCRDFTVTYTLPAGSLFIKIAGAGNAVYVDSITINF